MAEPYQISTEPTQEETAAIKHRVEVHKTAQTGGEYNQPGMGINLVLRESSGEVVGGVIASTEFYVMHLEVLWVSDRYRRLGYGRQLVLAAEQIAQAGGCRAGQTWTFAFQGPLFYPTIGYTELGVYDGYPDGLTEHVFSKQFVGTPHPPDLPGKPDQNGLVLCQTESEEELLILHRGLMAHVDQNVTRAEDDLKHIHLVVKDHQGQLVGGFYAWTTLNNLILEHIWVEEDHRGQGLGARLMAKGEKIARLYGCVASQAYAFSFQAPGFLKKMGYQILGVSEGFPPPFKQFYFIKKYG